MDVSKIAATLKDGQILTNKLVVFLNCCITFVFLPVLYFILVPILFIFIEDNGLYEVLVCLAAAFMSILFLIALLHIKKRDKNLKKKVAYYIEDAIEMVAYSKKAGSFKTTFMVPSEIRIQVSFTYNGKKICRESGTGKMFDNKYQRIYHKYSDRQIKILYSPKYDEVMILRD